MNQSEKLQNKLIEDESFILWVYTKKDPKWSAWLASNPDKKDIVENAKRIILSMKFKSEVPSKDRIEYIKNRIEDNIILLENRSFSSSLLWSPWIRRAAALLFLVSFIATMYFVINNTSTGTVHEVAIKHIEKSTQKGQKLTTFLPDGSRVMLNSNSKISYIQSFHDAERVVMLEGEAFFEIEKDTLRPFKVISNGITTTALGTSFNIDCRAGEKVEVSLVSGKVAVRNENEKYVILNPGEMAIAMKSGKLELDKFEYLETIAWKDGILAFCNSTFTDIVEKLELWYGVNIYVHGSIEEDFHFTAKYDGHTLNEVLQGIAYVQYFEHSIKGDVVEINFKPNN